MARGMGSYPHAYLPIGRGIDMSRMMVSMGGLALGRWELMPGIRGSATKENAQIVRALLIKLYPQFPQETILQAAAKALLARKEHYNEIEYPTNIVRGIAAYMPTPLTVQQRDFLATMDDACKQRADQITSVRNSADDADSGIGDFLKIIAIVGLVFGIPPMWAQMQAAFGAAFGASEVYGVCALAADGSIVSIVGGISTTLLPAEIMGQCILDSVTGNIIDSVTGNVLVDAALVDTAPLIAELPTSQVQAVTPIELTAPTLPPIDLTIPNLPTIPIVSATDQAIITAALDSGTIAATLSTTGSVANTIKTLISTGLTALQAATAVNALLNAKNPTARPGQVVQNSNGALYLPDGTIVLPDGTVIKGNPPSTNFLDTLTNSGALLPLGGLIVVGLMLPKRASK